MNINNRNTCKIVSKMQCLKNMVCNSMNQKAQ